MAANRPNPIPLYISGDASRSAQLAGGNISSSDADPDGSGAVRIYTLENQFYFGLLRSVKIYSRGTNGAGTAYIWIDDANDGYKECVGEVTWDSTTRGLVKLAGKIVYYNTKDEDPDQERMRGRIIREKTNIYVQIEDAGITDGYRAYADVRDMTEVPDLNTID